MGNYGNNDVFDIDINLKKTGSQLS